MIRVLTLLAGIFISPLAFANQATHFSESWVTAAAPGMSVQYPASVFRVIAGPAPKGEGRVLRSADGSAGLMYYTDNNTQHDSPVSFMRKVNSAQLKVDYTRVTAHFVVVSGVREGRIYYSRCNFPYGAAGPIHCVEIVYRESEKLAWDPLVTRISLTLK